MNPRVTVKLACADCGVLLKSDSPFPQCGCHASRPVNILERSADVITGPYVRVSFPSPAAEPPSAGEEKDVAQGSWKAVRNELIRISELAEDDPEAAKALMERLMVTGRCGKDYGRCEDIIQKNSLLRRCYFEHVFAPYLEAPEDMPPESIFLSIPAKLEDVDKWLAEYDRESVWRRRIFPIYVQHVMNLHESEKARAKHKTRQRSIHRRLAWCFLLAFIAGAFFVFARRQPGLDRPAVWIVFLLGSGLFLHRKWPEPYDGDGSWWSAGQRAIWLVVKGMVAGWFLMWVSLWAGRIVHGKEATVGDRPSASTAPPQRLPQELVSAVVRPAPPTPAVTAEQPAPVEEPAPPTGEETSAVVEERLSEAEGATAEEILTHEDEELIFQVSGLGENAVLRVRKRAGDRKSVVAWFRDGESGLRIIGKPVVVGTTEWVQILFGEQKGWVERRYLRSELEGEPPPVAAAEDGEAPQGKVSGPEPGTTAPSRSLAERLKAETQRASASPSPSASPSSTTSPAPPAPPPPQAAAAPSVAGESLVKEQGSIRPAAEKSANPRYRVGGIGQKGFLFVRQGPSDEHPLVAQLGNGQGGLTVSGPAVTAGTIEWVPIRFKNQSGWVKRQYLQLELATAESVESPLVVGDEGEEEEAKEQTEAAGSPDSLSGAAGASAVRPRPWQGRLLRVTGIGERDTLNVRRGPGARFPVVAQLVNGEGGITVVGTPVVNGTTEWVYITFGSESGWVSSQYLQPE
jgi:uncharacterized protein YraI